MVTAWDIVEKVISPVQVKRVNHGRPSARTATCTQQINTGSWGTLQIGVGIRMEKPRMDHGAIRLTRRIDGTTVMFLSALILVRCKQF